MILSKKQITKALIGLCECAAWSAPLIFANHKDPFSLVRAFVTSLLLANSKDRFSHMKAHLVDDESSTDRLQLKIVLDEFILELKIYSRSIAMKFLDVDR